MESPARKRPTITSVRIAALESTGPPESEARIDDDGPGLFLDCSGGAAERKQTNRRALAVAFDAGQRYLEVAAQVAFALS